MMKHGTRVHSKGYPRMSAGPMRDKYVHVLVMEAMLRGPVPEGYEVHHKDLDRQKPHWQNLELRLAEDNRPGCKGGPH